MATPWDLQPVTYPKGFKYVTRLDSSGQRISITYKLNDLDILIPHHLTLEEYLNRRSKIDMWKQWRDHNYFHLNESDLGSRSGRGLVIETPKIESRAFRSIFGGDRMSLNVTGRITIDGGMRIEKRSQNRTALNRGSNANFEMKQTQQFKVEGKVGENVSISVDQNSERTFEFENSVKLQYNSDEDGIVQSIEAGNVSLSLPGTRFVTFSAQNSGLFGIKSKFKIGSLDLTAIASIEKGQKKKLSIEGGQQEEEVEVRDYSYKKWTYFFLDSVYRKQFENYSSDRLHIIDPGLIIADIELYKYGSGIDESTTGAIHAFAVPDPEVIDTDTTKTGPESRDWWMVNLDKSDFELFPELGAVALNTSLMENEVLAVAYRDTSGKKVGSFYYEFTDSLGNQSFKPMLKLIKTQNPQPVHKSWDLEWKNVYSLGGRNIQEDGFELKIYRINPGGEDFEGVDVDGTTKSFLDLFGLDKTNANGDNSPDNVIDFHENFLNLRRGELVFPNLRPFDPGEDAAFLFPESLDEYRNDAMYDTTNTTWIRNHSQFYLKVNSSSARSANYSLGLNVIEGSEEVILNGSKLTKDQDYVIDYFSGSLTLLSERAMDPNANLDISYESQTLFSVDRKTLWGARAEYTLWERNNSRSFIGATILNLNEKTLDQKVRVGKGPMSNTVWDVNTSVDFQSETISRLLNDLPVLNVNGTSSFKFEGEVAQVMPNPNTLNNNATGDNEGVSYLDDFEGARRQINLGVSYNMWRLSSPPFAAYKIADDTYSLIQKDVKNRGHFYWYNPVEMVAIREVWPNREVTTQMQGSTHTHALNFYFKPDPSLTTDSEKEEQWGGVMRGLSSGYYDQTDSRFLEVWVQGDHGRVHIDLGSISEDVIPNNKLNTEDKKDENGIRNKQLDDDEDTGLDNMFGDDPEDFFHPHEEARVNDDGTGVPYDFWDLNNNGVKESTEPWSYDNYEGQDLGRDYEKLIGTEDNRNASMAIYPDTEDLNGNSGLDITNNYFEYTFSLEKDHPDTSLIAGGKDNVDGWRMYRIALDQPDAVVNNPEWTRIEYARIWIDSMKTETGISIVEINLVGNEWIPMEVDTMNNIYSPTTDSSMTIAVLNTHDNASEYIQPKGVEGELDPIQDIRAKEQALKINVTDLERDEEVIAQKRYLEDMNLINYKTLKMYVHGGDRMSDEKDSESQYAAEDMGIEFFLQLSSDANNQNYYEVSIPVHEGWNYNNIEVPFDAWSSIKLGTASNPDTILVKSVEYNSTITDVQNILRIEGNPSLTKIRLITIGIRNKTGGYFSGEIWLNELRLSNVRKDKGMAMRFSGSMTLGDFFSINGNFDRKDADFRTVNERLGKGNNTSGYSINSSIGLHKILPQSWGISLPVSVKYSENNSTPKYMPGSDILITEDTPDTVIRKIESVTQSKGISVSFRKQKSRNKFLRYLFDPVSTSFSFSENNSRNSNTVRSINTSYRGSFGYNLQLGKEHYISPLKWMGQGLFKNISKVKLYYLPSKFNVQMSGSDSWRDAETRSGIVTSPIDTRTATMTRNISSGYTFLDGIDFDYSRSWAFDMRDTTIAQWDQNKFYEDWMKIFESLSPGELRSETQSFSGKFSPALARWFKPNFNFSSQYKMTINPQMKSEGTRRSSTASNSIKVSGTFDPSKFVDMFGKKKSTKKSTTRRRNTRRNNRNDTDNKQSQQKEDEEGTSFLLKPVILFGDLFSKIDPIRLSYSQSNSGNHYGLLGTPPPSYQFGLDIENPGDLSDEITSNQSALRNTQSFSLSSGLKITSSITMKLDFTSSNNESISTQKTGSNTQSALLLSKGDPILFPNWSLNWRGLEKLPYIKNWIQSASLNHNFSGKKTENWSDNKQNITTATYNRDFRPLLGMNLTFKNKMSITGQYNTSEKIQKKTQYGSGRTRQTQNSFNFNMTYKKTGGMTIPFLGNKKLNNNIDFSMAITSTQNKTEQSKGDEGNYSVMSETKNWSVKPKMSYSFSSTVQGGMHFELGERQDKRTGKTSIKEFGIHATISLSGK